MARQIWRGPHIDIPPRTTILDLIAETAARQPERVALVNGISDRTITYVRLVDSIERVASALRAGGAGPGSCLAIYAPNSPEWAIAALAIMRLGGTVTGASPQFKTDEIVRHLSLTNAHWLLTVPPLLDIAKEAAAKLGGIEVIVEGDRAEGAISFSELLAGATPADCNTIGQEAPAMLPFSSGTTNLPKPVELTHRALVTAALQAHAAFGFGPDDRLLALAPFYFIAGSAIILFGGLAMGASVVTVPRFQFESVMDVVERHRISVALFVPPIMRMLAQHPEIEGRDLSHMRLIMCGGAHVSGAIEEAVARRFGATVVQAYGTTETSGAITVSPPTAPRPGTCGKPFPLVEVRIVDPQTGLDQRSTEIGEVWTRGPQLMKGYFADPEATREVLSADGWLRTGDLGFFDMEGYLHLSGRLKDLIKVNAFTVAPMELEALLTTHPAVADAAVVGRASGKMGEVPVAYIVPRLPIEPDELLRWVAERVAPYKKIRAVELVEDIPRSPAGKILRRLLTSTGAAEPAP